MNEIHMFNNKLNNSFEKRTDMHHDFKGQVDLLLKSELLRRRQNRTVLIIGAGKMDDFSLCFFMKYFDKVVVTDVDKKTMIDVVDHMKISKSNRNKLVVRQEEYTGFEVLDFFDDLESRLRKCSTLDEVRFMVKEKMSLIHRYQFMEYDKGKYDFVYVSPIYTQLVYNQVLMFGDQMIQKGFRSDLIDELKRLMLDEMVGVIDRFNKNLVSLTNDGGTLFVLSDIFEVTVGSSFERRIASSIMNRDVMDNIYDEYVKKYGMGLGDYGLVNLEEKVKVSHYKWLIWPFKETTNLVIKLSIFTKDKGGSL